MTRVGLLLFASMMAICLGSCGGGDGSDGDSFVIRIQSTRFSPKTLSITSGNSVQWINVDSVSHVVESGTLEQVSDPVVLSEISIRPNGTFEPSAVEANFGDTVRWRNDTGSSFSLDIVDDANSLIASFDLANGQVLSYSNFPAAGLYTAQKRNDVFFSGTVTLYGIPNPDGVFQSPTLENGDTFTRTFTGSGTLPFYVLDLDDPNKSFITGSLTVN